LFAAAALQGFALCDGRQTHVFRQTHPAPDGPRVGRPARSRTLLLAARAEGLGMGWVSIFDPVRFGALPAMPDGAVTRGHCVPRPGSGLSAARSGDRPLDARPSAERIGLGERLGGACTGLGWPS